MVQGASRENTGACDYDCNRIEAADVTHTSVLEYINDYFNEALFNPCFLSSLFCSLDSDDETEPARTVHP
jgi:hypothetical protein